MRGPRAARSVMVLVAVLVAAVLSGCDLAERVVGEPCDQVGQLGRDATHLLSCGADLRWEATITLDRAALILTRLTANSPTPATPGPIEQTTGCQISRRYAADAAELPPEQRKHRAVVTALGATKKGCGCLVTREWSIGMEAEAAESLRAVMDRKEADALAAVTATGAAVPIEARTVFVRAAWRSTKEQSCLRRSLGRTAEEPGKSFHELGVAIDIEDWEPRYGDLDRRLLLTDWCRTYPQEPWHYEYRPLLQQWGVASRCLD